MNCRQKRVSHAAGTNLSHLAVSVIMEQFFRELRVKVLVIRVVLGVVFALLLTRFFIPRASLLTIFGLAGLLTFAAYVLEIFHRGPKS